MTELQRIDHTYSAYRDDSDIGQLNQRAGLAAMRVSPEMLYLLGRARSLSEMTAGAFDITFGSVGFDYDYRARIRPSRRELEDARGAINYRSVELDPLRSEVRFSNAGTRIGLGGVAKGYAVERAARQMRRAGVLSGLVTIGGDSRFIGDRRGRPWSMGVQDPRSSRDLIALLPVVDEAVSTSGDYARYFVEDGVRYHHILDPDTGEPARGSRSVTVVGPDAVQTDGLSTGVFVLGVDAGIDLINALPGYEAVIVDSQGQLHYSSGIAPAPE